MLKPILAQWRWLLAFSPALVLLLMIVPLRVPVPYGDSWAFVEQYRAWVNGEYGWANFFYKHGDHPSAVGKTIYFIVLHWLRGDVGLLPLLSFIFSTVVAASVCIMSRPIWSGQRTFGAVLIFCANLTIFSAAMGGEWIWDFGFQNYIPGVCLASGLAILSTNQLNIWRIVAAAALSVAATFSFGSGFLVGALFSIPIWYGIRSRGTVRKFLAVGGWLAFNAAVAGVAIKAFGPASKPVSLLVFFDRPLMRLQFVCTLLGQMLGKGTVFEPLKLGAVFGAAFLLVFAMCLIYIFQRRHNRDLVANSLPWVVFCLFGLVNATLVCIGRMGSASDAFNAFNNIFALAERTLAERFITLTLFFVLGVVFLAATVIRDDKSLNEQRFFWQRLAAPVLTLFIAVQILNWQTGWHLMKMESILMQQERDMLSLGGFIPPDPERLWNSHTRNRTVDDAKFLEEHGRLRSVKFFSDNRLSQFQTGEAPPELTSTFEKPVLLDNGQWKLEGTCGLFKQDLTNVADLVLITAESDGAEERIVAIAAPRLPETFFERQSQRIKYPGHFLGWAQTLDARSLPKGAVTLRAYSFDHDHDRVHPISGVHKLEASLN